MLLRKLRRDGLFAELAAQLGEDEHANGRREVGVLALRIHAGHQIAQRLSLSVSTPDASSSVVFLSSGA